MVGNPEPKPHCYTHAKQRPKSAQRYVRVWDSASCTRNRINVPTFYKGLPLFDYYYHHFLMSEFKSIIGTAYLKRTL